MFISVHIPKTGGTTLSYFFDNASVRQILFDYSLDYSNYSFNDVEKKMFIDALPYLQSKYKFIHGHFFLKKYLDVIPDARVLTSFRHPVERIISQYKHAYYENMLEEGVSIIEFIEDNPLILKAQMIHLSPFELDDLDFIFMCEDLTFGISMFTEQFPDVISGWSGYKLNELALNTGKEREEHSPKAKIEITDSQKEEVFNLVSEEIDYYMKAMELYSNRKRKFLNSI